MATSLVRWQEDMNQQLYRAPEVGSHGGVRLAVPFCFGCPQLRKRVRQAVPLHANRFMSPRIEVGDDAPHAVPPGLLTCHLERSGESVWTTRSKRRGEFFAALGMSFIPSDISRSAGLQPGTWCRRPVWRGERCRAEARRYNFCCLYGGREP